MSAARSTRSSRSHGQKWWVDRDSTSLRELVARRVALVVAHEHVDCTVERRGEQQRLARGGVRSSSARTAGRKPMSAIRSASSITTISTSPSWTLAALDEVGEAARARDEDVDAAPQRLDLRAEAGTAVHGGDAELAAGTEPSSSRATCAASSRVGDEHEAARSLGSGRFGRARRAGCRTRASCPSRSGRARVTSGAAVGQGERLDGERCADAPSGRVETTSAGTPRSAKVGVMLVVLHGRARVERGNRSHEGRTNPRCRPVDHGARRAEPGSRESRVPDAVSSVSM